MYVPITVFDTEVKADLQTARLCAAAGMTVSMGLLACVV